MNQKNAPLFISFVFFAFVSISACSVEAQFSSATGGTINSNGDTNGGAQSAGGASVSNGGQASAGDTSQGGKPQGNLPAGANCSLSAQDCQHGLGCYNVAGPDAQGYVTGQCMTAGAIKENQTCPMRITGTASLCEVGTACFPDSNPQAPSGTCYRLCTPGSGRAECAQGMQSRNDKALARTPTNA